MILILKSIKVQDLPKTSFNFLQENDLIKSSRDGTETKSSITMYQEIVS